MSLHFSFSFYACKANRFSAHAERPLFIRQGTSDYFWLELGRLELAWLELGWLELASPRFIKNRVITT